MSLGWDDRPRRSKARRPHQSPKLSLLGAGFFLPNDQEALKESPPGEQTYFRCWISRSETSILTWCLGQHPNILPLAESGWIGDLQLTLALDIPQAERATLFRT